MDYLVEVIDLATLPPAQDVLSEREQAYYDMLKLPKRKTEWLGGRIALKKVVTKCASYSFKQIEVLPQEKSGKPQLILAGKSHSLPFSITHSHGYAVAAVAPQARYIGIDLEKVAHRISAWKQDFFHPSELTEDTDTFLTTLWTQKEAVVKLLGTGLTLNSFDVRCISGNVQFFGRAQEIYNQLGSPSITLSTTVLISGFQFSVAVGK
ncbi:MAG: 4'-phosphopantetheinyl transferase superfamily protein [Elusimicrobiaceae bacterium]|nr:4'-phosphopantetheinyl transferase superfamily protein [Elusimicrobiaceae bacterium]